jgi:Pentapeptide repeats (8 copies)
VATPATEHSVDDPLEQRYKRSQIWAGWAQIVASLAALATAFVAIIVARQSQITVDHDTQTALQQSEDTQLSTAIAALGSGSASERVAGMLLLTENTANRFTLATKTGEGRAQLFSDYTTALQTLSAYLSSASRTLLAATAKSQHSVPFGRGYGRLLQPDPIDLQYAVDQVRSLLTPSLQGEVMAEREGRPAIDLSNDELSLANFNGVNFGWVNGYLFAIDLRGATLEYSRWSNKTDLSSAYLQCADLRYSDFRGADLRYADLSGANVEGANFTGAQLRGVKIAYVYGKARWPAHRAPRALPEQGWDARVCMRNRALWQNAPAVKKPSHPARKHGSHPAAKHRRHPTPKRTR